MRVRQDTCDASYPEITVVFLHGIAASSSTWRKSLPSLTKDPDLRKVRFITLDLIGFGKAEHPEKFDYDYPSYRKALTRTLKKLKIDTPLVLCGHSMGCLLAIDYASNGDVLIDQLILVSPPIIRAQEVSRLRDQIYARLYTKLRENTGAKPVGALARFVDALSSFERRYLDTEAFRQSMDKIILNRTNYQMAVNLRMPMEVLHGRLDPLVISKNLHDIAGRNKSFHLTETFGGHDITGAKAVKFQKLFKETMLHMLLHIEY